MNLYARRFCANVILYVIGLNFSLPREAKLKQRAEEIFMHASTVFGIATITLNLLSALL
jgi:hypothetical protein